MYALTTDTGRVVAAEVECTRGLLGRMRGLLGRSGLPTGRVLLLDPCSAVHTVGMRFALDLIFVDAQGVVCRTVWRVPPQRLMVLGGRRARAVYEAASGWLTPHEVAEGACLRRQPASAAPLQSSPSPRL